MGQLKSQVIEKAEKGKRQVELKSPGQGVDLLVNPVRCLTSEKDVRSLPSRQVPPPTAVRL